MDGLTVGAVALQAWARNQGGTTAAAAVLGVGKALVSRWCNGKRRPTEDARAMLTERAGIAPEAWDLVAPAGGVLGEGPAATEPAEQLQEVPGNASAPGYTPGNDPGNTDGAEDPSVATLQARLRAIPAEFRRLGERVRSGELAVTAAEVERRLLEGEAKVAKAAIDAAGLATVAEVDAIHALIDEATRGCAECSARVDEGLRRMKGGA